MRVLTSLSMVLVVGVVFGCATGTTLDDTGGTGANGGAGAAGTTTTGGTGASGGDGGGATTTTGGGSAGAGGVGGNGGDGGEGGQGGSAQGGAGAGGQTTGPGGGGGAGAGGPGHRCGDGVIDLEEEEQCDALELGGNTCELLGFVGGTLTCSPDCTFDTSECTKCGNGSVEPQLGEECDFDAMGGALVLTTCAGLGFAGSNDNPGCDATCHYDTDPCLCGNGAVDAGELCDGADFDGKTCQAFGFAGGSLACTADCEILATGCNQCGNGMLDGAEACDGANLGGKTCANQGFTSGTLACSPGCQLDTSGCIECGDGTVEGGEQCDDGNGVSGDGCSATCQTESMACDPDGTYAIIQGGPVSYSCCSGLVSVNVSSFIFTSNGATVLASPSNPTPMNGAATTCPSGSFSNTGSIPGGCTETYSVSGDFTGPDTWSGLFQVSFTGSDCSCFNGLLGTPCVGQVYSITAMR